MKAVDCLIISSTLDYSTDLVCLELEESRTRYLRINRDKFAEYRFVYSFSDGVLSVDIDGENNQISPEYLRSVYFRAPVFLRESGRELPVEEQLSRGQWSAFIRNLISSHSKIT